MNLKTGGLNMTKEEKKDIIKKIKRRHGWKLLTLALFLLLLASIFTSGFAAFFRSTPVGADKAANDAVEFINENLLAGRATAKLESIKEEENLYIMKMNIGGQQFESYITKDGKYLFPQGIDLTEEIEAPTETGTTGQAVADCSNIQKTKKPAVNLFVMSHCPFGTQIEKGMLPVLKVLKDKIDFNLRFVYYAMHGETEVKEQLNQYCIQKEQNDKLIPYLECFLKEGKGSACLTEVKIDANKLKACTDAADKQFGITENLNDNSKWLSGRFPLFNTDKVLNEKYDIGGSPALVVNDQELSSGRDSASLLSTICCAFDVEPTECEEALSTAAPSPGFGFSTSGSGSTGSCG